MVDNRILLYKIITSIILFALFLWTLLFTLILNDKYVYLSLLLPLVIGFIVVFLLKLFLTKTTFKLFFNSIKIVFIGYLLFSVITILTYFIIKLNNLILNIIYSNLLFLIGIYIVWKFFGRDFTPNEVNYFNDFESNPPEQTDPIIANYFVTTNFSED